MFASDVVGVLRGRQNKWPLITPPKLVAPLPMFRRRSMESSDNVCTEGEVDLMKKLEDDTVCGAWAATWSAAQKTLGIRLSIDST
jgi:hypothetical protein